MALNFPTGQEPGYSFTGDNGVTYTYDGVKWLANVAGGAGGGAVSQLENNGYQVKLQANGVLSFPYSHTIGTGEGDMLIQSPGGITLGTDGSSGSVTSIGIYNQEINLGTQRQAWYFNNVGFQMGSGGILANDPGPATITLTGSDHSPCDGTYTRVDYNVYPPTWFKDADAGSAQTIRFENNGWVAVTTDINTNAIYVNTGSIRAPLAQWDLGYSGGPAPTSTCTYSTIHWHFGNDGVLYTPGNLVIPDANGIFYSNGDPYSSGSGSGSLGKFRFDSDGDSAIISTATLSNATDGTYRYDIVLVPGGEGNSSIRVPSQANSLAGDPLVIAATAANSAVVINTENGSWTFGNTGTLTTPGGIEFTSSTATIANVDTITVLDHIQSPAYQFANGVSILNGLATIVGNVGGDAALGALWFNTEDSRTYVRAGGYWVDANPPVAPAPSFYTGNLEFSGTTIISDTKVWDFGTDGNLSLPQGVAYIATQFDPEYIGDYDNSVVVSNNGLSVEAVSPTPSHWLTTALLNTPILEGEKKMFSIYIDRMSNNRGGYNGIGIATHSATLTTYIGDNNQATGVGFYEQGAYYGNTQGYGNPEGYTTGDIIDIAVDNDNFRIWMRRNGGYWNNRSDADPATNAYGYETGEYGTVYPGVTPYFENADIGNKFTLQTTPTYSVPAGFEFYGAELYESGYIKFGNNSLTVDHTGNLLVNGNLVTGSGGGSGGSASSLTNGAYEFALQANGVLTLGTGTISYSPIAGTEFRLWADNADITVYRNGRDGYAVKNGVIENWTDNGKRMEITSRGVEIITGNLALPTDGNVTVNTIRALPTVNYGDANSMVISAGSTTGCVKVGGSVILNAGSGGSAYGIERGGNIVLNTHGGTWTFGANGNLVLPTAGNINFANGVNILSTITGGAGTYANTDVASYLLHFDGDIEFTSSTARIGNVNVITVGDHIRSPVYQFANGTNILSSIPSIGNITFSDTEISGTGSNVTLTADTTDYVFYANANLVLPNNATITFANGVNILSTINGLTSISSSVTTGLYSDASGDYQYGTLSYSYAVNGNNGQFSIEYSEPLVHGNVDISVGNTVVNGSLTLANTAVPVHSYGAAGDKAGLVALDADYIYYCKSDFVGHTSSIVVDSDQWSNSVGVATSLPFLSTARAPETGWTISINFNSGVTTLTITGVTSLGDNRYQVDFNSVGSINVSNGNAGTLIDSTPAADIWVRTVWTDTNW